MIVNDSMIAADQRYYGPKVNVLVVALPYSRNVLVNVRTERSRVCSDFDVLHGLRGS